MRINLGCGSYILPGYDNFDKYPETSDVKYIDLDVLPLPFPSDYADEIRLNQVLEHVLYPLELCNECQRVLKPGGLFIVDVPVYSFMIGHRRPRNTLGSFDCLWQDKKNPIYTGDGGFKLIRKYGCRRDGDKLFSFFFFRVSQIIRDFLHILVYRHFVWEFKKK